MLLDALALFEDKFALSGLGLGTTVSTKSYDTLAAGANWPVNLSLGGAGGGPVGPGGLIGTPLIHDIGRGRPVFLLVQVNVAVTSAGALTLEEDFISDSNANLATTKQVVLQTPAVGKAVLVAGYRFPYKTVPGKVTQQFVGVQHVVGTAVATAGTLTAGLALGTDDHADILGGAP